MSIIASKLKDEIKNVCGLQLKLDYTAMQELRIILNRALNTWPEAPVDWKELSDMLEHGKVLQKYTPDARIGKTIVDMEPPFPNLEF